MRYKLTEQAINNGKANLKILQLKYNEEVGHIKTKANICHARKWANIQSKKKQSGITLMSK
ncbi:MAG: hypothetical protein A6F72_08675 [Cycloclasticus sp. symbiont of Poecilosclerida sp. N]|nr:MAG: hypothetical protein A6F72_08675 [Cycloclasticus sp. symbiont of Poecilosclerida sp. N]